MDSIKKEDIFYYSTIRELNFNVIKNIVEFRAFDSEINKMHEVKILNIHKIRFEYYKPYESEERIADGIYEAMSNDALILYSFFVKILNKKDNSIKKYIFFKKKSKQNDEEEYNVYFEAGDIFDCTILAEEIILDGERIKLL